MLLDQTKKAYIKNLLLSAAKFPAIYLMVGVVFIALSFIDDIFPLTQYKNMLDLTDKMGAIFIALALMAFIYKLVVQIFYHFEKKLFEQHQLASLVLTSIRKSLRIVYVLIVLNVIITLTGPTRFYLVLVNNCIELIIIGSIGWIAIQILYTLDAIVFQQTTQLNHKNRKRAKELYTRTHIIRNILTVVIILITFAAMLMTFSSVRSLGISLLASAGFLTAIVGLASQKALFSLFSGLQIALAQPIKIGDIVVIENETGIIEEIGFTYVILKLADRRRMVLPINYFIEKHFLNWSHDPEGMRSSISFHVDCMMPIQPLRNHLNEILAASKYWDGKAGKLLVANLAERAVELQISMSAANEDDLSDLRAEIREKILEFIQEKYPQYFPHERYLQSDNM